MAILQEMEDAEIKHSSPRKLVGDYEIYASRAMSLTTGMPVLCDFGEAVLGNVKHNHDIMPDVYRAPEVILDMDWGYKVDVWNVGVLVCICTQPHI